MTAKNKQLIKERILKARNSWRRKMLKTAKYAAISGSIAGAGLLGYKWHAQADETLFDTTGAKTPATMTFTNTSVDFKDFSNFLSFANADFLANFANNGQATSPSYNLMDFYDENVDYRTQIPQIDNDILKNIPNIDFFNYCFERSNKKDSYLALYAITPALFDSFRKEYPAMAALHKIKDFNKINFDKARIIAKTAIYDKFDIGYIKNASIAAYLYHGFVHSANTAENMHAVANTLADVCTLYGIALSKRQNEALKKLRQQNGDTPNIAAWRTAISVFNGFSDNTNAEYALFESLKSNLFQNQCYINCMNPQAVDSLGQDNANFIFEPTIKPTAPLLENSYADMPLAPLADQNQNKHKNIDVLLTQKDKDLAIFRNIYMQCSYNNYLNLSYGNKKKTFQEADKALTRYHIDSKIHRGLYCAGMSMASFCQAAEIFMAENPQSPVSTAITRFLDNCQNVHSCLMLMHDLGPRSVVKTKNLEKDTREYMKNNPEAILFVWSNRGGGNYHHQTLFPTAEVASDDAYTYCAYNNNHWGNEQTFSRHMSGNQTRGGYFSDIEKTLNTLAERHLLHTLKQEQQKEQQKAQPTIVRQALSPQR